jgi:hypothetical protein
VRRHTGFPELLGFEVEMRAQFAVEIGFSGALWIEAAPPDHFSSPRPAT